MFVMFFLVPLLSYCFRILFIESFQVWLNGTENGTNGKGEKCFCYENLAGKTSYTTNSSLEAYLVFFLFSFSSVLTHNRVTLKEIITVG
jgi:hypothetical protein